MKILHTADIHIGVENYGKIDPETRSSTRLSDFLRTFDEIVEFAINEAGRGTAWKKKIQPYIFLDNILDTKIEENSYDTIVCRYLGEHFEDDQIEIFLDNIHKITKRFVYFGITSIKSPHFYLDDTHVAEYDLKQWEEILTRSGKFEIQMQSGS